jgi:hypothetical protein
MDETLHGLTIRNDKIVIAVTSYGCTEAGHFKVNVASGIAGFMVTVVRSQPDHCKMIAHIKEFELELPVQLHDERFTVQNAFAKGPRALSDESAQ